MTSHVTTHVLDTALGHPAAGVTVTLSLVEDRAVEPLAYGVTDDDGRVRELGPEHLPTGTYRLTFDVAGYFAHSGRTAFFPSVDITFALSDVDQHHHVPLLLSPFAYSTYRGS
ncbi:5-hydroxyisourate hydrolase [Mumia flava]|uniref:5-hydroxyisourate hydrolase n=1 Tax=Mumia flava TaxID=1348852 RepID=A0A0B2BE07_9ACTN|nr:hydroxyisourate hydrolase [Mumia flava]PJJ58219.1 5-hydroxyisourate hydrolase [Mumia flava]